MANHFSTIGLSLKEQDQIYDYFHKTLEFGEKIISKNGAYVKWVIDKKIELWAQLNKKNEAIGLNPHFFGSTTCNVKLNNRVDNPRNSALDGSFYAYFNSEDIPFVFDVPNMDLYDGIVLPQDVTIQLAAFAHEVKCFDSDQAFFDSQEKEPRFAAESFIPSGLFIPEGSTNNPPQPYAIFSGHIVDFSTNINSYSSLKYYWLKISVLGSEVDTLIDISLLEKEPVVGGVIQGSFWLAGRIISEYKKEKEPFFNRMLK